MRANARDSGGPPAKAGPGRRPGLDSVETRQRVIDAAIRCFARYGYGPATNSQIAEAAGVTAGAVYYHFGTKSRLFEAVVDEVYGAIVARSADSLAGALSVPAILRNVLAVSMRINREFPDLAGFVAAAPVDARRHPELSNALARLVSQLTDGLVEAIERGQGAGVIPAELDPVAVAGLINAVVDGFAHAAAAIDPIALATLAGLFDTLLLDTAM